MAPTLLYSLLVLGLVHGGWAETQAFQSVTAGRSKGHDLFAASTAASTDCSVCQAEYNQAQTTCEIEYPGQCCDEDLPFLCSPPDQQPYGTQCCGLKVGGSIISDPIFTSFAGHKFEFFGDAGRIYNVLSSARYQVNMLLVEAGDRHIRTQPGNGTFAQTFAFQVDATQISVSVSEDGKMSVLADDEDLELDQPFQLTMGTAQVKFDPYHPGAGERLEVVTDQFQFAVVAVPAFEDNTTGYNREHLDLSVTILSDPGMLGGILGSTILPGTESDSKEETFYDAGNEHHYLVSTLFGRQIQSARVSRSLIEMPLDSKLIFPLTAGLGRRA